MDVVEFVVALLLVIQLFSPLVLSESSAVNGMHVPVVIVQALRATLQSDL